MYQHIQVPYDQPHLMAHMNPKAIQQIFKMVSRISGKDSQHVNFCLSREGVTLAFETRDKTINFCIHFKQDVMYDAFTHPRAFTKQNPNQILTFRIEDLESLVLFRNIGKFIPDNPIKRKLFQQQKSKKLNKPIHTNQKEQFPFRSNCSQQQNSLCTQTQFKIIKNAQSLNKVFFPLNLQNLLQCMNTNLIKVLSNDRQTDYLRKHYQIFYSKLNKSYQESADFKSSQTIVSKELGFEAYSQDEESNNQDWVDIEDSQQGENQNKQNDPKDSAIYYTEKKNSYLMLLQQKFKQSLLQYQSIQVYMLFFGDRIKVICNSTDFYSQNQQYAVIQHNLLGPLQWKLPSSNELIALAELHPTSFNSLIARMKRLRLNDLWLRFDSTQKEITFGGNTKNHSKFQFNCIAKKFTLFDSRYPKTQNLVCISNFQKVLFKVPSIFICKTILVFKDKIRMCFGSCQSKFVDYNPRKRYKHIIEIDLAFNAITI